MLWGGGLVKIMHSRSHCDFPPCIRTCSPSPPPFPTPITLAESPCKAPCAVFDGEEDYYGCFESEPECYVYGVEEGDGFEDCEEGAGSSDGY
jgi:hypothetical protein